MMTYGDSAVSWLRSMTLEQAEYLYRAGRLSQGEWEAYAHAWQTGVVRFGGQLVAYAAHPDGLAGEVAAVLGCCRV